MVNLVYIKYTDQSLLWGLLQEPPVCAFEPILLTIPDCFLDDNFDVYVSFYQCIKGLSMMPTVS